LLLTTIWALSGAIIFIWNDERRMQQATASLV
jgi:hypothetical protein